MALSTTLRSWESCLASRVETLRAWGREAVVSEWVKISIAIVFSALGSAVSASLLVWNLIQDHEAKLRVLEVRMMAMEKSLDGQAKWHEAQYEQIAKKLTDIQVDIGRIQGARDGGR